jgi:hypothetical protein
VKGKKITIKCKHYEIIEKNILFLLSYIFLQLISDKWRRGSNGDEDQSILQGVHHKFPAPCEGEYFSEVGTHDFAVANT